MVNPLLAPGVLVTEDDRTGSVPGVSTSTGAFVGDFRWGPVDKVTSVSSENDLVAKFAAPSRSNSVDFHVAASFLQYSTDLKVVRAVKNALNASNGTAAPLIKNTEDYDTQTFNFADHGAFLAKYPGALGNSLKVSVFTFTGDEATTLSNFNAWAYASSFETPVGTSLSASSVGASNDEIHIAVIDEGGLFTGNPGSVLETFPYLSQAANAKNDNGTSQYFVDHVNLRSKYVWFGAHDATNLPQSGVDAANAVDFVGLDASGVLEYSLADGVDSETLGAAEYTTGVGYFDKSNGADVSILIGPNYSGADAVTIANAFIAVAATRKDLYLILSPRAEDIDEASQNAFAAQLSADQHYELNSGRVKAYDKYNDTYVNIPDSGKNAGSMALSDRNNGPWFSPAGQKRGQLFGVTELYYNPNDTDRGNLYKNGINPIVTVPGKGTFRMGDKTRIGRPSIFRQVHAVRLFILLRKTFKIAGEDVLFQFNDEFTRAEFVSLIEPLLRQIQGRRGITEYRIICDESNNGPDVVDAQEFNADIYIKIPNSINFVRINLIATRSGVDLNVIEGVTA